MVSPLQPVRIEKLPQSIDEFVAWRDQVAEVPQGGAAMIIVALLLYAEDEVLGRQCLTVAVDRERLEEGTTGYKGWQLRRRDERRIGEQVGKQPYIARSYIKGATPENGYELPPPPYEIEFTDNPYSGDAEAGPYKVFVACSGAAKARPVTLRRNSRGVWKAYEWSSLVMGIREPDRLPFNLLPSDTHL